MGIKELTERFLKGENSKEEEIPKGPASDQTASDEIDFDTTSIEDDKEKEAGPQLKLVITFDDVRNLPDFEFTGTMQWTGKFVRIALARMSRAYKIYNAEIRRKDNE